MTFETTISQDDLVAFNEDYVATTFGQLIKRNRWISSLSSAAVIAILVWLLLDRESVISAVIVGALVGLIVFLTTPAIQRDRGPGSLAKGIRAGSY